MRLAEPIETTGMFWLPERPETGLSGVLRISETSEIMVEFAGVIGNPPSVFSRVGARASPRSGDGDSDLERIVGTVEKGGRITLTKLWNGTKKRRKNLMPASCPGGPHPRFTGYSCLRPSKWSCGLSEMSNPWPGTISEVNVAVDEFPQTQVLGEGHRKEQPSIGHQAAVVEGDLDPVGVVAL